MNEKEIRALVQAELSSYDLSREVQVEIPDEAIEAIAQKVVNLTLENLNLKHRLEILETRVNGLIDWTKKQESAKPSGRVNVLAKVKTKEA